MSRKRSRWLLALHWFLILGLLLPPLMQAERAWASSSPTSPSGDFSLPLSSLDPFSSTGLDISLPSPVPETRAVGDALGTFRGLQWGGSSKARSLRAAAPVLQAPAGEHEAPWAQRAASAPPLAPFPSDFSGAPAVRAPIPAEPQSEVNPLRPPLPTLPEFEVPSEGDAKQVALLERKKSSASFLLYLPLLKASGLPEGSISIGPEQGGTLATLGNRLVVEFPAGAVTSQTLIQFQQSPIRAVPDYSTTGLFFHLTAQDEQGAAVTQFQKSLRITTSYNDTSHLDEAKLALYYLRGEAWIALPSEVDAANNRVITTVDHFTQFALLAPLGRSWVVGQPFDLCAGTEIWHGPLLAIHTIVPEDDWRVMVIGGPRYVGGETWWNTSRFAAGDPSGGTGWISQEQEAAACSGEDGEGGEEGSGGLAPYSLAQRTLMRQYGMRSWQRGRLDPVGTSGNFVYSSADLTVPGLAGFDLVLVRTYNSRDERDGLFGMGQSSLLDMALRIANDGSIDVRYADGHGAYFMAEGDNYVPGDDGILDTLEYDGAGFTLTTPEQTEYLFDAQGYLLSIQDRHENKITLERDGTKVTSITDSGGREYMLSYEGEHVASVTDPAGRTLTYEYADGDLVAFTDARGGTYRYEYESHHMTTLTDPAGITYLQNVYDGEGRVTEQTDASGSHSSIEYSDSDTTFNDNLGNTTIDRYDDRKRVIETVDALGQSESFTYDDDDNLTSYTDKRGNEWTFEYDEHGNLLSSTDPQGHTISYTYNEENDLTSLTDEGGPGGSPRTTTFAYENGSLVRVERPDGTTIEASYDGKGQMESLTDPAGRVTSYAYNEHGDLVQVTDPLEHAFRYDYDIVGRMLKVTDAQNHAATFAYDPNDNITRITDPKGQPTTFEYDPNDNLVKMTDRRGGITTYEYDENLKLIAETDPEGHKTTYEYDPMYNLVAESDARGNSTRYGYDALYQLTEVEDALGNTTTFRYDPNGNLVGVTDALGHETALAYDEVNQLVTQTDALGGVTSFAYDAVGRLISTTNARGAVTQYEYDLLDQLTLMRDALGGEWELAYDAAGNLTALTDANGHRSTMSYDDADRLTLQTDPLGHETKIEYDAVGNTTQVKDALGRITTYEYDENDNLVKITNTLDGVTALQYDAEDAVIAVTDANEHTTRYAYDLDGLLIQLTEAGGQVSLYEYDATHNLTQFTNAKGNAWSYRYDALNQLVSESDPLDHATRYVYDAVGQLTHVIDANEIVTAYQYDALGRLAAVVQNENLAGITDHETNVTTRYGYDPVGNLTKITDANGHITYFTYDLLDQVTKETNPLGRKWLYEYDAVGNLIVRTDAKGQITRYQYDADDQLIRTLYPDGTQLRYAYDAVHNQTRMTDSLGPTTNKYDDLNRLISSTNHVTQTVSYSYDPVGNRLSMTYPDQRVMKYEYDETNYQVRAIDPDGNVFEATRDATHNITRVENPNLTVAEYDIDAAERLTAVRNFTLDGDLISTFAYTLDPVGNRTRVEGVYSWRKPTQLNYDYSYDPLYRLVLSTDSEEHFTEYEYDAVGNRLRLTTNDDPTLWREIDTETTLYTYDDANELITTLREVQPRGRADRALQAAQALRAFSHELAAQAGKHIDLVTARALLDEANALITSLESEKPPSIDDAAAELDALRGQVEAARDDGRINASGTANSLLVKLGKATEANASRGGELLVTTYDYDANGNRIRRTMPNEETANIRDWFKTEYEYDYENRLVHVQDFHTPGPVAWLPMDETMLTYDGYGRVFRRLHDQHIAQGGQKWIDYVYDGLDPIVEYEEPNPQYINYYRGLGHILSMRAIRSGQGPGTLYYYHYDGLDSVSALTKHLGQSAHTYRYHDFGIILDINGHAADASNFTDPHNHYAYTGQEWDEYTELHHFYARDYDPKTGTWLQQDPYRGQLTSPTTLHRYGYVMNRPLVLKDPYGYCPMCVGAVVGFVGGAIIGGGVSAISQAVLNKGQVDWNEVKASAVGGAVSGAICGATVGLGCAVGGGAAGGAATQIARDLLNNNGNLQSIQWGKVAQEAVIGGVTGFATWGAGTAFTKVRNTLRFGETRIGKIGTYQQLQEAGSVDLYQDHHILPRGTVKGLFTDPKKLKDWYKTAPAQKVGSGTTRGWATPDSLHGYITANQRGKDVLGMAKLYKGLGYLDWERTALTEGWKLGFSKTAITKYLFTSTMRNPSFFMPALCNSTGMCSRVANTLRFPNSLSPGLKGNAQGMFSRLVQGGMFAPAYSMRSLPYSQAINGKGRE